MTNISGFVLPLYYHLNSDNSNENFIILKNIINVLDFIQNIKNKEAGTELVSVHAKNRNGVMPFRFFAFYVDKRRAATPSAHIFLDSRPLMRGRFHFQPSISHERKIV